MKLKAKTYNNQDIKKNRLKYNDKYNCFNRPFLEYTDIFDIIETQGLECHYCKDMTNIIPKKKYDSNQFTLDRIDNNDTHHKSNLLVCCFECNEVRSNDFTSEVFKIKRN